MDPPIRLHFAQSFGLHPSHWISRSEAQRWACEIQPALSTNQSADTWAERAMKPLVLVGASPRDITSIRARTLNLNPTNVKTLKAGPLFVVNRTPSSIYRVAKDPTTYTPTRS
ncbi:MAG: hypothetical protein KGQ60_02565 [Planctomycetes bacterium]|nr:hypothetical protein [Planctomycetota bacterium]